MSGRQNETSRQSIWTEDELRKLFKCVSDGMTAAETAALFPGRTTKAIAAAGYRYNVRFAPPPGCAWTPAEDAKLRKLMSEGASLKIVLSEMPDRSRRSVLGRAHRLGIPWSTPRKAPKIKQPKTPKAFRFNGDGKPLATTKLPACFNEQRPVEQTKGLFDLRSGDCRWVYEYEDEKRYCGSRKHTGSFCQHHAKIAYRAESGE